MLLAQTLINTIEEVGNHFNTDELAYLALTHKVEYVIRDKLAFCLHKKLSDENSEMLVCRELNRIDLAVVCKDKPLLLLEAKAIYTFDVIKKGKPHKFPEYVLADFEKAAKKVTTAKGLTTVDTPVETFTLVIATHPHNLPNKDYHHAVKYLAGITPYCNESNNYDTVCNIMSQTMQDHGMEQVYRCKIAAGCAFGVEVSIFLWLYKLK